MAKEDVYGKTARGNGDGAELEIADLDKEFKPSRSFREQNPERLTERDTHHAVDGVSLKV